MKSWKQNQGKHLATNGMQRSPIGVAKLRRWTYVEIAGARGNTFHMFRAEIETLFKGVINTT
jgi:hypothetical protein